MANNQSNTKRTKFFVICAVLLFSAVTGSWTLSERPLNNHECYVAITSREMLESGDLVMPTCNGEPRLEKTPLSYWLVAGLAKITGKVDEFSARLPSAVFGVLSVAAVIYFVNQWLSFRIAVLSAAVWATSLGYTRYSHNARPEMALTFFIMLCFLTFYSAVSTKSRKRQVVYMLIFWISFGLANLAKGPAPLPLVLVPLFFYVAVFRQWKQIPKLLPIIGTVVFLAIVLPWPLAIASRMNWDLAVWKREFVDRFFGAYASGHKPFYYYLPKMFQFMLPWAAFVPFALAAPFYRVWNKKQPVMQFLWLWFVVDVAFLTISGGKRQHYIIPTIPAMAVLTAIILEDMAFCQKAYTHKAARIFLIIHLCVLTIGLIVLPIVIGLLIPEVLSAAIISSAAGLIGILIVAMLFRAQKARMACWALFVTIAVLIMLGYTGFTNPLNYNQPSRRFTQTVAQKVPASDKLIAYKSASARFVHYSGRQVPKIQAKSEVYELYEKGSWVVAFGIYLDELLENGDFEIAYRQEKAERHGQEVVGGALLHRSGRDSKR
ncbi:MAG TPA: glycosyltransferase family 39 protein [Sedimentisphaerales bacterium]|nr:glycosyltransferase family 39 protein [Sedimentisphaerales bacterium]